MSGLLHDVTCPLSVHAFLSGPSPLCLLPCAEPYRPPYAGLALPHPEWGIVGITLPFRREPTLPAGSPTSSLR